MARSGTYLEALVGYYSTLAFDAMAAMRSTQEDLRTGKFSCEKVAGRTLSLWMDATEGWWSALLVTGSAPLPTVFLRVGKDQTLRGEAHVLVPGGGRPLVTNLERLGGGARIETEYINVEAIKGRNGVEIKLKLEKLREIRGEIAPGLYQGVVFIDEKPLAMLLVQVEPPPAGGRA